MTGHFGGEVADPNTYFKAFMHYCNIIISLEMALSNNTQLLNGFKASKGQGLFRTTHEEEWN
jgi:hypothetical protein